MLVGSAHPTKGRPSMIVDVHSHCWPRPDCFSPAFQADAADAGDGVDLVTRYADYRASTGGEEVVSLVFAARHG